MDKPVSIYKQKASGSLTNALKLLSAKDGIAFVDFLTTNVVAYEATGSITQANTRLSAVAGTAFLDASLASVLTDHVDKYIELIDPTGKKLTGWIKAAGTGETYTDLIGGTNPALKNGDFSAGDTVWSKVAGSTIHDGAGYNNGTAAVWTAFFASVSVAPTCRRKLYNFSITVNRTSGGLCLMVGGYNITPIYSTSGTFSAYITPTNSASNEHFYINNGSVKFIGDVDNVVVRQVLTPSTTGVTIVNSYQGTTYNWLSEETGFNHNSSTYTYKIYSLSSLPLKLNYLLKIKDSAGKFIQGWVKAAGGGLTLAAAKTVVGITKANPGVLTLAAGHGYANGDLVYFSGLTQMTGLNTKYRTLEGNSGDTFTIGDTSSEAAAETTGGSCVQKVTIPAATGVTVVSAKAGTTYNWAAKDSAFNYNDSSGYTYEIWLSNE